MVEGLLEMTIRHPYTLSGDVFVVISSEVIRGERSLLAIAWLYIVFGVVLLRNCSGVSGVWCLVLQHQRRSLSCYDFQ
jgi:hypothetical protein